MEEKYNRTFRGYGFVWYLVRVVLMTTGIAAVVWSFIMARIMDMGFWQVLFPLGIIFALILALGVIVVIGFGFGVFKHALYTITREQTIGPLKIISGAVIVGDPLHFNKQGEFALIESAPLGEYQVQLTLELMPKAQRIIAAKVDFMDTEDTEKSLFATLPVSSFLAALVDKSTYTEHYQQVGPDRIGLFSGPKGKAAAEKIQAKLGLDWEEERKDIYRITEPVTENMENGIKMFLSEAEKGAFSLVTNNTFDDIAADITAGFQPTYSYTKQVLDHDSGANILALTTSYNSDKIKVYLRKDRSGRLAGLDLKLL